MTLLGGKIGRRCQGATTVAQAKPALQFSRRHQRRRTCTPSTMLLPRRSHQLGPLGHPGLEFPADPDRLEIARSWRASPVRARHHRVGPSLNVPSALDRAPARRSSAPSGGRARTRRASCAPRRPPPSAPPAASRARPAVRTRAPPSVRARQAPAATPMPMAIKKIVLQGGPGQFRGSVGLAEFRRRHPEARGNGAWACPRRPNSRANVDIHGCGGCVLARGDHAAKSMCWAPALYTDLALSFPQHGTQHLQSLFRESSPATTSPRAS